MKYQGLITIDLDGTLLQDFDTISQVDRDALKKAHDLGYAIAICTGRSAYVIHRKLKDWQIEDVIDIIVGCNGSEYFDFRFEDEAQILGYVTREEVQEALSLVADEDFGFAWYDRDCYYTNPDNPLEEEVTAQMGVPAVFIDKDKLGEAFPERWAKGVFFFKSPEQKYLQQMIEEGKKGDYKMALSDPVILEMIPSDIDKGIALKAICKNKNIDLANTMAIGDRENDKEMLEVSSFGVAMGNATDELKAIADYITTDVKNNGVALAIEEFIKRQNK